MFAIISVIISALVSHNVIFYGGLAPFCPKCNGNSVEKNSTDSAANSANSTVSNLRANPSGNTKDEDCRKRGRMVYGAVLAAVMFVSIIVCYFINKLLIRLSAEYLFAFLCVVVPALLALGADFLTKKLVSRRADVAAGELSADIKASENKEGKAGKADKDGKVGNAADSRAVINLKDCNNDSCDHDCGEANGSKTWGSVGTILIAAVSVTLVVALKNTSFSAVEIVFAALFSALGYLLALAIMGGIAERMETANIPRFFRGAPVLILAAAIIALAVFAFESFSFSIG